MNANPTDLGSEDDLIERIRKAEQKADSHTSAWRKEARENYDMVAGDGRQWDQADKARLQEEGRPCVEFNRLGTIIDAVAGSEVNNRQEVAYIPRIVGDVQKSGVANLRTAAAHWARDNCDAADEESDAFVDTLICGMGFTQTRMDYEEEEEGKIVIERADPLEFRWDPAARKRNLADARWISRKCKYTRAEILVKWPDKADQIAFSTPTGTDDSEVEGEEREVNPRQFYQNDGVQQPDDDLLDVTHWQEYVVENVYKVLDPQSGQIVEMDEERLAVAQTLDPTVQSVKTPRRHYLQAFTCGGVVLEFGDAPCQHGFTFQAITGKRDRNRGYWYGLVRPMKDPQRWANKFFSQLLHIINVNAKGGILYEAGATDNPRKLERDWPKSDSAIRLNPGGLNKVQPKPLSPFPTQIGDLMQFSVSSIRDSTGVNLELLGMVDREQAGVLEAQRTRAGLTILAPFFDSLRLYRIKQGRVLAYFVNEYIADGRLIRVAGPQGEQFIPLMKEGDIDYDVVVDSAPTSRDTKEQAWAALQHILPFFVQQGIQVPVEAFDFLPLPESLIGALKQAYMQKLQQSQQPPPQMMEELANKRADTEAKEATAAMNYAKAGQAGIAALQALFGPQPNGPGVMPGQMAPVQPGLPQPAPPMQ